MFAPTYRINTMLPPNRYFEKSNPFKFFNSESDIIKPNFMTLIVAVKSRNGVVLAGDKRTSDTDANHTYSDNTIKVFQLNDKVAIGGAGDGFDAKAIIDELIADSTIQQLDVDGVKNLLFDKTRVKQAEWYNDPNNALMLFNAVKRPQFGFLLIGLTQDNKPKIYNFAASDNAVHEIMDSHCEIGITEIAKYIMFKQYKDTMTVNKLGNLASLCISETSKISTAVSSNVDLVKIST